MVEITNKHTHKYILLGTSTGFNFSRKLRFFLRIVYEIGDET